MQTPFRNSVMRPATVLTSFLAVLTLAWLATAPSDLGLWPLVDAQGAAGGWWWLRRHGIYLSGIWAIGLMSLAMVLALRLPVLERPLGGMDQVYRLHKWAGIGVAITAVLHWLFKQGGSWIAGAWGTAGKPGRDLVWAWLTDSRGLAKDLGEWMFYLLLVLVLLTLWQRLLSYKPWRVTHRLWPVVYLVLVFHTVALTPVYLWRMPLGLLLGSMLLLGSAAALWSLAGGIGVRRRHAARVQSVRRLGEADDAPLEVVCALAPSWPGHRAGQFAFVRFHRSEDAHPFTIASAPDSLGQTARGEPLLRLLIKPLGDYTRSLPQRLQAGQAMEIEGPYGRFDGRGESDRQQVWIAAGVGITPFLALLEARQPGATGADSESADQPVHMHYCVRDAASDPLLPRVRQLCAQARPAVQLRVHDQARGQRLTPQLLEASTRGPLDIWFCGPMAMGDAIAGHDHSGWQLHREFFAMR